MEAFITVFCRKLVSFMPTNLHTLIIGFVGLFFYRGLGALFSNRKYFYCFIFYFFLSPLIISVFLSHFPFLLPFLLPNPFFMPFPLIYFPLNIISFSNNVLFPSLFIVSLLVLIISPLLLYFFLFFIAFDFLLHSSRFIFLLFTFVSFLYNSSPFSRLLV